MLELRADTFNAWLLGVSDEQDLAGAGSVDVVVELADGGRYAGTVRTLADIDGHLTGVYLPLTDTVVVRELTGETIATALGDLIEGGVLDEVFLEVLEEVEG